MLSLDNNPQDRASAADKRSQEVVMVDERGRYWCTRGDENGGERWPACGGREATVALAAGKRCIMGERRRWRQIRGDDLVAAAGRQVM